MPRAIVTGNGQLLATFNHSNLLEDLYFPYVGMENQIAFMHVHRIGVFLENNFSWMGSHHWHSQSCYTKETLVTDGVSENNQLGLRLEFNDFVYPSENFLMRKITVVNQEDREREVKLFFAQDFHLYGNKELDTAFYEPEHKAIIHYRKRRYFWVSGMVGDEPGVHSFTTGKSEYQGLEGTWRDAEDGHLHEHPIDQGSVDSTVQFNLTLPAKGSQTLYMWIAAGQNLKEVTDMHQFIVHEGPEDLLKNTQNYWRSWVNKERDRKWKIPKQMLNDYKQSLLIIRTQIDNGGAILAANDSDIMKFNKDTYSYAWPRDGAWVALGMDHAGYGEITERFFQFCADTMTDAGYLLHKYNPDQSVGSSWHAWYKDGEAQLPIQEDETGIVLYALWKHFERFKNIEFAQKMYRPLIRAAGNFLLNFIDEKWNLPLPSYDLWERERGIFSYTCATVYAGLSGASKLCEVLGHFNHQKTYAEAAKKLKKLTVKHLYDEEEGRFLKRIQADPKTGLITKDKMIDASLHGLWMMEMFEADDPKIIATNQAIYRTLSVPTHVGGIARSEHDDYQRVYGNYGNIQGNPWIITTLWHAQWLMARAKTKKELKPVKEIIEWAMGHMNPAGILPEQLNPFNGESLSVAPLTWSHSTFVDTVLQYEEKLGEV